MKLIELPLHEEEKRSVWLDAEKIAYICAAKNRNLTIVTITGVSQFAEDLVIDMPLDKVRQRIQEVL